MAVKLQRFAIADYRQFHDIVFDFTHPETGEPLQRICLIGGNGTGKSTVLKLFWNAIEEKVRSVTTDILIEFSNDETVWQRHLAKAGLADPRAIISKHSNFSSLWETRKRRGLSRVGGSDAGTVVVSDAEKNKLDQLLALTPCLNCPPESELAPNAKKITDVPTTNLNEALASLKHPASRVLVGQESTAKFWTNLIALIKDREAGLLSYQKLPENKDRTIREVEEEFLASHPDILKELADFWNVILERVSLEFDYEGAAVPVQLTDNLKAYIRLKNGKGRVAYADLSTGIRHFIFRLGHIFTVFRGDPSKGGIILVDEPENSLHPDFLFDLISHYERAAPGAQLFMATHSPIVAAQFRPEERFILEFDDSGHVTVRRGVSPEGDDPNDLLMRDFAVRTLYGKKGLEQWRRFRELDRLIQNESDSSKRRAMIKEYMEIGRTYNFAPDHEVSA